MWVSYIQLYCVISIIFRNEAEVGNLDAKLGGRGE